MRHFISTLCFLCIWVVSTISGQPGAAQEKRRYVVLPSDQGLLAIANQPDCPLEFEGPKLLQRIGGGWGQSFNIRNRGAKPIRAFTVGTSHGSEWGWKAADPAYLIMPGQKPKEPKWSGDSGDEIVPLTEELRDKLKLRGSMKGVVILMVVRVEYADDTVYDAEQAYKAMYEYFHRVDAGLSILESRQK
jgi:hypothetical protein